MCITNDVICQRVAGSMEPTPRSRSTIRASLILSAAVLSMHHVWSDLISVAWTDPEASHVLLLPPVIGYLIWVRRDRFSTLNRRGALCGSALIGMALIAHEVGLNHEVVSLWHASAILSLLGGVVLAWGFNVLIAFAPTCVVLFLLVPVPGLVRQSISMPLQLLSAYMAEAALSPLGLDIHRIGYLLTVNGTVVAIAEACNGMRMLFAVLIVIYAIAFSVPIRRRWQLAVFILTPLSALAMNLVRIMVTVLMFGCCTEDTARAWHDINGWLVPFTVMSIAFIFIERLRSSRSAEALLQPCPRRSAHSTLATALAAAMFLLVPILHLDEHAGAEEATLHHKSARTLVSEIPFSLGDWVGTGGFLLPEEVDLIEPTAGFRRHFVNLTDHREITMLVMLCSHARRLVGHEPGICFVGQGWKTISNESMTWEHTSDPISGRNYRFRFGASPETERQVASILLVPSRPSTGDIAAVAGAAADFRRGNYGSAIVVLIAAHAVPDQEWRQMTEPFIDAIRPLARQFRDCQGVGDG